MRIEFYLDDVFLVLNWWEGIKKDNVGNTRRRATLRRTKGELNSTKVCKRNEYLVMVKIWIRLVKDDIAIITHVVVFSKAIHQILYQMNWYWPWFLWLSVILPQHSLGCLCLQKKKYTKLINYSIVSGHVRSFRPIISVRLLMLTFI